MKFFEEELYPYVVLIAGLYLFWYTIRALKRGRIYALWVGPGWSRNWHVEKDKDLRTFAFQVGMNLALAIALILGAIFILT